MPKAPSWPVALVIAASLLLSPAASGAPASPTLSATAISKALPATGAKATVTVQNPGTTRLTGLTLRAAGLKGVKATISGSRRGVRALRPLKAGGAVRITVTLRRAKGGPTAGNFGLRLRKGAKTVATGRIAFGPNAAPAPTAPAPAQTLTGRYYWGATYGLNGNTPHTLYFTGPDFVYTDEVKDALPTCAAASEDCRPYTYDAKTKALVIDGKPATITDPQLTFDQDNYYLLGTPQAGARFNTTVTNVSSAGLCPLSCTTVREDLTFMPDGTFTRNALVTATSPSVDVTGLPPDRRGAYEVRADRTLRLAFADGKERIETIGIYPENDGTYLPSPDALILGGDGYFNISK